MSGPLLDRIDLHVEVPAVRFEELSSDGDGESIAIVRPRVLTARAMQRDRFDDAGSDLQRAHGSIGAAPSGAER